MPLADFGSLCLPYVLKRTTGGAYIALNRGHNPIGFQERASYAFEYTLATHYISVTTKFAAKISWNGSTDSENIFLYHDSCVPTESEEYMNSYLNRLSLLASLRKKR